MLNFTMLKPISDEHLGLIPFFLHEADPRSAAEQFNERYAHGGGWDSFDGFKLLPSGAIKYPGDPALEPIAEAYLRDEIIRVYPHAWVGIFQSDGSYEISRMD